MFKRLNFLIYDDTPYAKCYRDIVRYKTPGKCPKCPNVQLTSKYLFEKHIQRYHPNDSKKCKE